MKSLGNSGATEMDDRFELLIFRLGQKKAFYFEC